MTSPGRELPSGTITFLFSDIEGSTPLLERLGTSNYRGLIEKHNRLLREVFSEFGGVERGTEGDSFMVAFESAPSAVQAAVSAQKAIAGADWPESAEVRVRIGLHTGEGVRGADDYVGIDINRAARVSSAAHGGQILVSESTRVLSEHELPEGVMMRDLGHYRLKGLHRPERLFEVVVDGLTGDFPPPLTAQADSVHVPVRLTSFIGRQAEIDKLLALLAQSRIVTLTGAGGTGKTSLAVEAGRKAAARFADGVWFVDLAPLDDVSQLESAVTGALGLSTKSQRPTIEILEDHLSGRQLLLILDNFEHLLPGAELVARLISAAPHLTVLVTSRTGLNLYGEQVFPVPPLGVPESFAVGDPDQVAGTGAVALFVERAGAVRPDFSLNADNAEIVSDICRRLDGLPLAIELAASRVRVLDVDEILERLDQRLPVLPTGEANRPLRHQTLERLIGWSYDLLRPTERRLFERLSIFVGGHTIEAADSICNPAGELGIDMLEGIASLEGHSLIRRIPAVKPARFEMLETIRRLRTEPPAAERGLARPGREAPPVLPRPGGIRPAASHVGLPGGLAGTAGFGLLELAEGPAHRPRFRFCGGRFEARLKCLEILVREGLPARGAGVAGVTPGPRRHHRDLGAGESVLSSGRHPVLAVRCPGNRERLPGGAAHLQSDR